MSIYAISDLHLSFSGNKPMDIFYEWENHAEKICNNWWEKITEKDYVLMPGDFSWATYLSDATADFEYLNKLPGTKVLSKGNHDYWFETLSKLKSFVEKNQYDNIHFIQTNAIRIENNTVVCGTRGWYSQEEDGKIFRRELIRLKLALDSAKALNGDKLIVMLHYPPQEEFIKVMDLYKVDLCVYGHLHRFYDTKSREDNHFLVSADYLNFSPIKIL